ncbi:MAG: HD domain-containing protein, partial [Candidatus Woesearchaeota archaeon]|nr:HD domain-containing protein [Candidatus Woesearchaeota archaeon]
MPRMSATRFDHSLGVYFLLKRLGAGREEQIAGLIHDIGHTALSHVYDYAIGRAEKQDYNDEIQEKILNGSGIKKLLEKEGMSVKSVIDHKKFPLLEKELPDLCADRFDYLLRDTLYYGTTKKQEIPGFINSLNIYCSTMFINDKSIAVELTLRFMDMNDKFWSGQKQNAIYSLAGQAMKIAMDRNIIKENDFFDTDDAIMEKLKKSGVGEIISRIELFLDPSLDIKEDPKDYDF